MRSWVEFWDSDHPIYVNERHKAAHAEGVAADFRRHIAALRTPSKPVVLDYGCGEANYAEAVAGDCMLLLLCDAAPTVRDALARRTAGTPTIRVVAPDDVSDGRGIPAVDLIVVNSLLQYLGREQLVDLLRIWRSALAPEGCLVVADVIPPHVSPLTDASALLRFGWRDGFVVPVVTGLVRTALSDYSQIRKRLGFSMYTEQEILVLLAAAGFEARRVHPNFGHNQARMTFEARL